ncbi:NAD-dependent epimerase/dehydratase family protein [Microbacterium amylolyticum]|uniref:Nucleoside-diphosphate-sugar epimerase n=1 Tax=Microbacterium amylolyticum TaxID=936337 RepID=A0ABS4ZKV9_9MICO|nr:NAD(P)-dependent oxidoreductase [Microbacterium amylolyticum]MBP2437633.1 nucleoside-diphosphate-sugar epimerase [Microbacterium amylolyticum]
MTRVAVTGGAGRLGASVIDRLIYHGYDVVSFDRVTSDRVRSRQVTVDLLDEHATQAAFAAERPDAVVHLAAIAVPGQLPDPEMYRINTQLVWSVLEATTACGANRMLLASSPTVLGYHAPAGWTPDYLPLDEDHPVAPWNGYSTSKVAMEGIVRMAVRRGDALRLGIFRPCYVIAPEEWEGAPTQQGHTVNERLANPLLSAVALFNYVDARDAGDFVATWITKAHEIPNGETFFVGAPDALATQSTADAIRAHLPAFAEHADSITAHQSMFSSERAERLLGWRASRLWRDNVREPDTTPEPQEALR